MKACSEDLPNAMERIRHAACQDKRLQFATLWHHVYNIDYLRKGYFNLKRNAAPERQVWTVRHGGTMVRTWKRISGILLTG